MIGGDTLRARLGELARRRRSGTPEEPGVRAPAGLSTARAAAAASPPPPAAPSPHAVGVEAYLPGGEWRDERGSVYVHERLRSQIEHPRPDWGWLEPPAEDEVELGALHGLGLGSVMFLDLETGGFGASPVFLAGTMHWNGSDFVLRQYFARHYGEEASLLRALDQETRRFGFLVTFNGKSYDAPLLRDRARVHAIRLRLPPRHVDLLHAARRRWKSRLADCRLQTIELYVCRRRRWGDVPGEEVPGLYHDYVRRGDPYRLIPVFHHNLLDVITLHEILRALCGGDGGRARER